MLRTTSGNAQSTVRMFALFQRMLCLPAKPFMPVIISVDIAIYCSSACSYKLRVTLNEEYEMADGERAADKVKEGENRLYVFKVPNDSQITSITVNLHIGTTNSSNVMMFVASSKDRKVVPSSTNTIRVVPSWLGLSAVAYENTENFCRDCFYKVLVTSKIETSFVLSYRTNKGVIEIARSGIDLYDTVADGKRNCYKYTVQGNGLLSIYLKAYSGFADFHVNPTKLPELETEFEYDYEDFADSILSISEEERRKDNANTYYICVYSLYYSSYNLLVLMQDSKEVKRFPIYSGITRSMWIAKDNLILFEYTMKMKEKLELEFILTSISGNANLYAKYCIYITNSYGEITNSCILDKENLSSDDVFHPVSSESTDYLSINFDPSMCIGKNVQCSYLIGVLGVTDSKFSLAVTVTDNAEMLLLEGIPLFGTVGRYELSKFTFTVKDTEATSVKIQLASMSGDADMWVEKETGNEYKFTNYGYGLVDSVEFKKEKGKTLDSAYHVTVIGYSVSTFTLAYNVISPRYKNSFLQLYDGLPYNNVFYDTDSSAVYSFGVSFPADILRDIRIFLLPITGQYRVLISAGFIPTAKNYTWELPSDSHSILISSKDSKYKREGVYFVLVEKQYPASTGRFVYTVKFVTGQYASTLLESVPEVGNLTRGDIAYYKFFIANTTNNITVSVTPLSGDPNLYISLNSSNQLPSSKQYDFMSSLVGADSITIPSSEIMKRNKYCIEGAYMGANCGIYIAVTCATETCTYSLQLGAGAKVPQRLLESIPQFGIIEGGTPVFYVFTPNVTNNPTTISIQPVVGSIKAYLIMADWNKNIYRQPSEMPSPNRKNKTSNSMANSEVITVSQEESKKCGSLCNYFVGVYPDLDKDKSGYAEFNIIAMSSYVLLTDGRAMTDYVDTNAYRYYKYNVACTKCTLVISLVPLSRGDPDLYMNKGSTLPSREKSDFKSATYGDDVLEIDWEDNFFKGKPEGIKGEYTIAVYGYKNCTFTITASTSSTNLQELSFGVPTRVEQYQGEITYYAFSPWKTSSMKISLVMMYGRAVIRVNVFQDYNSQNINDYLPSKDSNSIWSSLRSGTNNYLIISKDDTKYKAAGTYLVGIETQEDSNFDIIVEYINDIEVSYIDMERPRRLTVASGETIRLAFIVNSYENITCSLYTYYGRVTAGVSTSTSGNVLWDLKQNSELQIFSNDRSFSLGTFYITIKAEVDSDFMIQVKQAAAYVWLSEGFPQVGNIGNTETIYYKYRLNRPSRNHNYALNIHIQFSKRVIDASLLAKYATDDTYPNKNNADFTFVYDQYINLLGGSIVMKADKSDVVTLALSVVADSADKVQYSINAWTSGIIMLNAGASYFNRFQNLSETHIYELPVVSNSKMNIKATLCSGSVEVSINKNLVDTNNLISPEMSKGTLIGSFDATRGNYYVTVKPKEIGQRDNAIYYLIDAVAGSFDDAELCVLENNGDITYKMSNGEIELSWGKVLTKNDKQPKKASYVVFMSEEGTKNMFTACGMMIEGATVALKTNSKTKGEIKPKDEFIGKRVVLNVVAIFDEGNKAYNPITLEIEGSRGMGLYRFIIFLTIVGIIGAVVYYWNKLKQENHSLPRMATEPIGVQNELRDIGPISQYERLQ